MQKDLDAYLKEHPLPWPQIFEKGGLDSRPANELGILTVPTMILIDGNGKVVEHWDVLQTVPVTSKNENGMF